MRRLFVIVLILLAPACGGKSTTPPASQADTCKQSDGPTSDTVRRAIASVPVEVPRSSWVEIARGHTKNCRLYWVQIIPTIASESTPQQLLFFDHDRRLGPATPNPKPYITVLPDGDDTVTVQYQWRVGNEEPCCPKGIGTELAFERSGPERILTTAPLILAALDAVAVGIPNDGVVSEVGDLVARMVSLRQMSVAVARRLVAGESAGVQAALVKDLGTCFEQDSVDQVARLLDGWPTEGALKELCDAAQSHRPMFTLRGGTNEVLRGIVARGIGLR